MKFEDFIRVPKPLAMVITVEEYKRIKPLLQEFYSEKDFAHIDDFCQFVPSHERFLLCNPYEKSQIITPMMLLNAVTFIDRVPFKNIVFPGQEAPAMRFTIETMNDNGSGMKYFSKEDFLKELSRMIDDCVTNGGTFFEVQVDSDASCSLMGDEEET